MDRKVNKDEMTLLDWFAGQALMGILIRDMDSEINMADQAIEAYEIAETMILVRGATE